MDPLKPLGQALSRTPPVNAAVPLSMPTGTTPEQPISAFQWISLAKATWTWILRPLWYLCFKWPAQLFLVGMSTPRSKREWDWRQEHNHQQGMKMTEAMTRDMRQER